MSRRAQGFGLAAAALAFIVSAMSLLYLTAPPGAHGFEEQRAVYGENGIWLLTHIVFGAVALTAGASQFVILALRAPGVFHRWAGTVYAVSVMFAAPAGFRLAFLAYGGAGNVAAFALLAMLWLTTTFEGVRWARRGDIARHRLWIVRSYALTFAAVTLRIETGLFLAFGAAFTDAYRISAWTCWVLNLLFAEWVLLKK
ncbi:MAG: DUF2306 domain-containing protein [Amphiplicatus sp.]